MASESIRMLFELDRADDPSLYDDLIRFRQGTKRVNRLRLLAHEGAVAANAGMVPRLTSGATISGVTALLEAPSVEGTIDMPFAGDVFSAPITD
jgi:hypothetical protein